MLSGGSFKDENIISRSFRFISPALDRLDTIFEYVDYDIETCFFSTAVGDNRYINPLPGFGYNTDPCPALVRLKGRTNYDFVPMGRYYNRIYDRNATLLTLTAGAPEFTGILRFIANSFDYAASLTTNKGRTPSLAFYFAEAVTSIAFYPLQIIGVGLNFLAFLNNSPTNQWYYVKPAMGQYIAAAQGIFNDLLTAAGYILPVMEERNLMGKHKDEQGNVTFDGNAAVIKGRLNAYYHDEDKDTGISVGASKEYVTKYYKDAINEDGTIDIAKLATRGVRKYRHYLGQIKNYDEKLKTTVTDEQRQSAVRDIARRLAGDATFTKGGANKWASMTLNDYLKEELDKTGRYRGGEEISSPEIASSYYNEDAQKEIRPSGLQYTTNTSYNLSEYSTNINNNLNKSNGNQGPTATGDTSAADKIETIKLGVSVNPDNNGNIKSASQDDFSNWMASVETLVKDSFYGGFDAVTFRVEGGTGAVSDSFSNSTQQSEVAGFFNGTVSAVNNFRFNIQGGATGFKFFDDIVDRVSDALKGVIQGAVVGGPILAALGNSRLVIPEHWADSATNLHTESFQIKCNAMYATDYSIATQIYLPLALILPFVLPACTGGSTYTTPFMCRAFSQGRTIIKTGIIKNASISFGEGELGWTRDRKPLNMTINLEIADLDPICAAPVTRIRNPLELFDLNAVSGKYLGDIGKYNDYVARATGRDYLDTVLVYNRLNRALTNFTNDAKELFSPGRVAGIFNDSIAGDALHALFSRPLNR